MMFVADERFHSVFVETYIIMLMNVTRNHVVNQTFQRKLTYDETFEWADGEMTDSKTRWVQLDLVEDHVTWLGQLEVSCT